MPHKPVLSVYGTGSVANSAAAVYAHKGIRPYPKCGNGYRGPRGDVNARHAHMLTLIWSQLSNGGRKLVLKQSATMTAKAKAAEAAAAAAALAALNRQRLRQRKQRAQASAASAAKCDGVANSPGADSDGGSGSGSGSDNDNESDSGSIESDNGENDIVVTPESLADLAGMLIENQVEDQQQKKGSVTAATQQQAKTVKEAISAKSGAIATAAATTAAAVPPVAAASTSVVDIPLLKAGEGDVKEYVFDTNTQRMMTLEEAAAMGIVWQTETRLTATEDGTVVEIDPSTDTVPESEWKVLE